MIEISKDAVLVYEDEVLEYELPHLWIRDNCSCDACRVKETQEKQFILSSVELNITPTNVTEDQNTLIVDWPDKHQSIIELDSLNKKDAERYPQWESWDKDFLPSYFDWELFLEDDNEAINAFNALLKSGVFVLANAPQEPESLEDLSPRMGPLHETLFERIHNVSVDGHVYNIAHTSKAVPPHNDFASYSAQPSVQALHMLQNECKGGHSVVVDGWTLLEDLKQDHPDYFDILVKFPVPFREFDEDNETYSNEPIISLTSSGAIKSFRFSNQLMQTINPNTENLKDFYIAYHELCNRVNSDKYKATFRLESGQALIVASHRVLHARESFVPSGKRHLQDAYFVLDNAANNLVLLKQKNH